MKKLIYGGAALTALLVLGSCATTQKATLSDLTGEWNIVAIDGKNVIAPAGQELPYVGFDVKNGQIFGNASCNSIFGYFDTKSADGVIRLSDIGTTRMACPDMQLEQSIVNAFGRVDKYRLTSSGDVELCAGGKVVMTLAKRQPTVSSADLDGEWSIVEIAGVPVDEDGDYSITFDSSQSTFGCTTDCNIIGGTYQSEFVDLTMNVENSTMMDCPESIIEDQLKAVLPQIASFGALPETGIGLYSADGVLLLTLRR